MTMKVIDTTQNLICIALQSTNEYSNNHRSFFTLISFGVNLSVDEHASIYRLRSVGKISRKNERKSFFSKLYSTWLSLNKWRHDKILVINVLMYLIIFGWSSVFKIEISRIAVADISPFASNFSLYFIVLRAYSLVCSFGWRTWST